MTEANETIRELSADELLAVSGGLTIGTTKPTVIDCINWFVKQATQVVDAAGK
jgi:hypothetical protein